MAQFDLLGGSYIILRKVILAPKFHNNEKYIWNIVYSGWPSICLHNFCENDTLEMKNYNYAKHLDMIMNGKLITLGFIHLRSWSQTWAKMYICVRNLSVYISVYTAWFFFFCSQVYLVGQCLLICFKILVSTVNCQGNNLTKYGKHFCWAIFLKIYQVVIFVNKKDSLAKCSIFYDMTKYQF